MFALVGVVSGVRHRRWNVLAYLAAVGLGVSLVNNALKWSIDRERPDIARLTGYGGSSFPSGHTAAAAACWAALALVAFRFRPAQIRWVGAIGALVITVGVAASRVLLGVHWLTDVIAGSLVGWAWFTSVTLAFGGRLLRLGEPAERIARRTATDPDDPPSTPPLESAVEHTS
ncbi:MAG: phosphatase PAP2 family protein [Ilumatobacteraceae bacterium]